MQELLNFIWVYFLTQCNDLLLDWLTKLVSYCAAWSNTFWDNGFVVTLMNISVGVSMSVFMASFVITLFDVSEAAAEEKPIYVSSLIGDFIKSLVFAGAAPYLGLYAIQLLHNIIAGLNWAGSIEVIFGNIIGNVFFALITAIVALVFLYLSLKNSGLLFCQLLTCALYVPSICRGDHSSMGAWMRLSVSILLTYFFQYLLFYCGLYLAFNNDYKSACVPWFGMFAVSRVLDKFGFSSGSGGIGQAANLALQGAAYALK